MILSELVSKNKILTNILGHLDHQILNQEVKGISSNSKDIKSGYIFVAIKGKNFDGESFIKEAKSKGAFLILAENKNKKNCVSITKGTSRLVYSTLLSIYYKNQPNVIIGVTGTNGKTSTVEFCRQIWVQAGWKAASMGTLGTKVGTHQSDAVYNSSQNSLTTFEPNELYKNLNFLAQNDVSHLALEASSHGLDQFRLDGIKFSGAIFTNLSRDHLDYHGNIQSYFSAKKKLFMDILKKQSAVAINIDNEFGKKLYEEIASKNHLILTFGENEKANIRIKSITHNNQTLKISIEFRNKIYDATLGMIGKFQAYNVIASASICIALGMEPSFVFKSLSYLKPARGRMEIVSGENHNSTIIIDYAHTPEALKSVLLSLKEIKKDNGKLITLFGCGGDRDKGKRKLMGNIAHDYSDIIIITDDNPRNENPTSIRNDILNGCPTAIEIPDRNKAIKHAVSLLKMNDFLLIAGKGHETLQTVGLETLPFDDYAVAKEALKTMNLIEA